MDVIFSIMLFISMMVDEIDCAIMKKVNIKAFKEEKTLFESDEDSLLQCAQRCKFIDTEAVIDFRNYRCRCIKYQSDDELQNQGTLTKVFVNQKIMKIKENQINGGWSDWKNSTNCTEPCGNGTLQQVRVCMLKYRSDDCTGIRNRTVECNTQECSTVNIALGKKAKISSLRNNNPYYSASKAFDGNIHTVTSSQYFIDSWLEVDLGEVKVIENIHLNALVAGDDNKGLLAESRRNKGEEWTLCKNIGDIKKKVTKFKCMNQLTNARFFRIKQTKLKYLYIYEIEIYGY